MGMGHAILGRANVHAIIYGLVQIALSLHRYLGCRGQILLWITVSSR